MPESKNRKFFYLSYGESIRFKLLNVDNQILRDSGSVRVERLASPIKIHVSSKPFANGRKMEPCAGENRCPYCATKNKPQTKFPVSIIGFPNEPMEREYLMDLSVWAHDSVLGQVQGILDRGGTATDITNTIFMLERLQKGEKPGFTCRIATEYMPEIISEKDEFFEKLTDDDILILKKINNILKTKAYAQPRGSVIKTLQEKYHWTDTKIELAFSTVLDDNGYLMGENG